MPGLTGPVMRARVLDICSALRLILSDSSGFTSGGVYLLTILTFVYRG